MLGQIATAREERARRLKEGHGHAEKHFLEQVWWPAFGQFQSLHAEYEVYDFRDGGRFVDFAFVRSAFQAAIEIDGYGPHHRNLSRWQFSDGLLRQNHLIIDGWKLLRFSYDDIVERPRLCQQQIQQLLGRWLGEDGLLGETAVMEKEIVRLTIRLQGTVTPADVCNHLGIKGQYARKLLHSLVEKNRLRPHSGTTRVRSFTLDAERKHLNL
jgi:very-short-patch-repair endonuclease